MPAPLEQSMNDDTTSIRVVRNRPLLMQNYHYARFAGRTSSIGQVPSDVDQLPRTRVLVGASLRPWGIAPFPNWALPILGEQSR